jgi:hypothetical protein
LPRRAATTRRDAVSVSRSRSLGRDIRWQLPVICGGIDISVAGSLRLMFGEPGRDR